MNDNSGRGRGPRPTRAVALMIAVTSVVLLAAACGSGGSSSAAAGSAQYAKALAYAQCMRSHGVPGFPDPDSQGHLPPLQIGRNGVTQQAAQAAQDACRNLQPGGGTGASEQQARLTQALNFAKCMRAHGVPDFPDPASSNGGIGYNLAGIDTDSPQYQSAQGACQSQQSGSGQSSAGGQS
jgi:hypothetical protein